MRFFRIRGHFCTFGPYIVLTGQTCLDNMESEKVNLLRRMTHGKDF